jgi:diguanylate cyclase (GGDEF)-like protein
MNMIREKVKCSNAELAIVTFDPAFQQQEKCKRAAELAIANKELAYQNEEKDKRAAELASANKELAYQNDEKGKRAAELAIANKELAYQNDEKSKRAAELATANIELAYQNDEKDKRAAELAIANKELAYQNDEKDKRAAELNNLAFYDPLTGLPNRRLLIDRLHHAIDSSIRTRSLSVVMFIDLDKFKDINDTLGHGHGDLLLEQTAQRLESCIRKGDTAARFGGDEFVLIIENLGNSLAEATAIANIVGDKIVATLSSPYNLFTHEHNGTASIGAVFFGHDRATAEDILKQADIAMYQAKQAGRNTLVFFN